MKLQQLLSYTRKAIDDYHMIEEGDKIAIGISGGKDSLTLLYALSGLRRFYPVPFEIEAIGDPDVLQYAMIQEGSHYRDLIDRKLNLKITSLKNIKIKGNKNIEEIKYMKEEPVK
jgi:tRNA(Ile)-lysidine synthase TilS/MesJ